MTSEWRQARSLSIRRGDEKDVRTVLVVLFHQIVGEAFENDNRTWGVAISGAAAACMYASCVARSNVRFHFRPLPREAPSCMYSPL